MLFSGFFSRYVLDGFAVVYMASFCNWATGTNWVTGIRSIPLHTYIKLGNRYRPMTLHSYRFNSIDRWWCQGIFRTIADRGSFLNYRNIAIKPPPPLGVLQLFNCEKQSWAFTICPGRIMRLGVSGPFLRPGLYKYIIKAEPQYMMMIARTGVTGIPGSDLRGWMMILKWTVSMRSFVCPCRLCLFCCCATHVLRHSQRSYLERPLACFRNHPPHSKVLPATHRGVHPNPFKGGALAT